MSGPGELQGYRDSLAERINRVRGPTRALSPSWQPAAEPGPRHSDPWIRRLALGVGVCFLLALALFVAFKLSLVSGVSEVSRIAAQSSR